MAPARAGSAGSSDEQPPEAGAPQDGGLADMGAATSTQVYLSCFPGARPSLAQYNCKHSHRLWCHACMWAHMLTSVPAKAEYVQLMLLCQLRGCFFTSVCNPILSTPICNRSALQQKHSCRACGRCFAAGKGGAAGGAAAHARAQQRRRGRARRPVLLQSALHPPLPHGVATRMLLAAA